MSRSHWENVYDKKEITETGWYQKVPVISLDWILKYLPERSAPIIDMGGGDSLFTDALLEHGYTDITILDISKTALSRAAQRLKHKKGEVQFICNDAAAFIPNKQYQLWHDRAAFHFLHTPEQLAGYYNALHRGLKTGGLALMATFSEDGPASCSGLPVQQYSLESLRRFMGEDYILLEDRVHDHITPSGKAQNYVYALFRKQ